MVSKTSHVFKASFHVFKLIFVLLSLHFQGLISQVSSTIANLFMKGLMFSSNETHKNYPISTIFLVWANIILAIVG